MTTGRRALWVARAGLVLASIAYRWPVLANAWGLNSDVAIVGLQARHLPGEWSPFLWGSGYQSSTDAVWAGLVFALVGPGPTALLASALALQIVLTLATFEGLRRLLAGRPDRGLVHALLLSGFAVFSTPAVHSYALNPPRQASITLAVLALALALGAESHRRATVARGLAAALGGLACYADPYALLFTPAIAVAAGAPALRDAYARRGEGVRALVAPVAVAGGGLIGQVPGWLLRHGAGAQNGTLGFDPSRLAHNRDVLLDTCLPWALALRAWAPKYLMDWAPYPLPRALAPVQWLGAVAFCGLLASGAVLAFRRGPARLAGLVGAGTAAANLLSFLGSVMIFDHFAMRYLAALAVVAPFAAAPLASRLPARWLAALLAPWFLSASVCAWVAYLPFGVTRSPVGRGDDERALRRDLEARGVEAATADYWACYRLDFLWEEAIPVAPIHAREDRYAPYRRALTAARRVAYIYDAGRSREGLAGAEEGARALGTVRERFTEGLFTVFVVDAPPPQKP